MIDKNQEWENLHKKFKRVVDRLGKHIDDGIMDTVVAFNAINIYTTASCQRPHVSATGACPQS